ncbi:ankyrin 2,3/unc44 [Metarhizium acridum CQMa 102]|uniref:Ankyrin 2,3/unc44 n=1 Tax=Metarhizium acridum (strain CQMa 102) TaxID=655827 RepID=E9DRF4_METAQ|nr:ankyrin 2,3/unc44 [Metarhizium acridum CQMa 102]EFY93832.1 ankyrin 2,3/unc44 [Metarhizium acridum CQMa 102]
MASMNGHQEVVKLLADNGIGVTIKDNKGCTALFKAVESGFVSIVRLLVKTEEVSADIKGGIRQEALLFAAEKGYTEMIKILLESNVDCDSIDPVGSMAMSLAAANRNTPIVELLLRKGAKSAIEDGHKRTALHHAAWGAFANLAVSTAFGGGTGREKRANANVKSDDGQTALHRAAWGGSLELVTLLRKNGADPSLRGKSGNKPWKVAAEKGHELIVKVLLGEEHSLKEECILEEKALISAPRMGYSIVAASLLERGIETAVRDKEGRRRTAPRLGVQNGHVAVVEELLEKGADANIQGENGRTALHLAAQNGNLEIVQILVKDKADPHVRDVERRKAWPLAAEAGYNQIVRLRLKQEVDLHSQGQNREELFLQMAKRVVYKDGQDTSGKTTVRLAAKNAQEEVVRLLLWKGADLGIPDSRGQTPLLWAARTGSNKYVSLFLEIISSEPQKETQNGPFDDADSVSSGEAGEASLKTSSSIDWKESPIEAAVVDGSATVQAKKQITNKEAINHNDYKGRTALLIAIERNHDSAAKLLLNRGSPDIDIRGLMRKSALHLAAEKNNTEKANKPIVEMLLKIGAEVNIQDWMGRAALLLAAENGDGQIVDLLLNKGAQQQLEDSTGRAPLLMDVAHGDKVVVKRLLADINANLRVTDSKGRNLLSLAVLSGSKGVVWLLPETKVGTNRLAKGSG